MSLVINQYGDYEFIEGTKVLKTSDQSIYRAAIELNLPRGEWLFAPQNGHELKKYLRDKQKPETKEAIKKELLLYTEKYDSSVQNEISSRASVYLDLEISDEDNDV